VTSSRDLERTFDPWRVVRLGGSALLFATGAIHLDLYLTGYNTIPTIGGLFLLQVIGAFVLALATIVSASRVLSAAAAGFLLSTLAGYLLSRHVSLFGFREVRTTAGVVAGVVEIAGFALLTACALRTERSLSPSSSSGPRSLRWAAGTLTVVAVVGFAGSLDPGAVSTNSTDTTVTFKVVTIHGVSVLTNARGYTLYWFAPDTPTASHCSSTCAAYWPPVIGTASTNSGVAGNFATVTRSDGAHQVTYDGHPLYTYVGDAAPGQASGNDIKLNGGYWYEMRVTK
jgi:predicted lipoprotein with Yx(FWY)xxD motif